MSPRRCVVGGCSNCNTEEISLHCWPQDPKIGRIWTNFVQKSRTDFAKATQSSEICSEHFREDAFYPSFRLKQNMGFTGMRRKVLPGKYPTLRIPKSRSSKADSDKSNEESGEPGPSETGSRAFVSDTGSSTGTNTVNTATTSKSCSNSTESQQEARLSSLRKKDRAQCSTMNNADSDGWVAATSSTVSRSRKVLPAPQPVPGGRHQEIAFRITCLDKKQKFNNQLNYHKLGEMGLGIPASEMINGKRYPTKVPATWSVDQLRLKIADLFPRLLEFGLYRFPMGGVLSRVTATTARGVKRELKKSCLYIVPFGPLAPLDADNKQLESTDEEPPTYLIDSPSQSESSNDAASQAESLRSISPSICSIDSSFMAPLYDDEVDEPEPPRKLPPEETCAIRDCGGSDFMLHSFPKDEAVARRWADFVRYTQRDFVPSGSDRICSRHFRSEAYEAVGHMSENLYGTQDLYRLGPSAVPTILYAYKGEEDDESMDAIICGPPAGGGIGSSGLEGNSLSPVKQPKNMLHFVKLTDINAYITCYLCGGYMYNATTITECLHSFCRKCILQHFQKDNKCPNCDILVHESIPFHFIRHDGLLQMIINKLVPSFEITEKEAEKKLQEEQPDRPPTPVPLLPTAETVPIYSKIVSSAQISLQLEYIGASSECPPVAPLEKSFVRVSSMATISHVQKFISHKLHLGEEFEVDIICGEEILQPAVILYNLKREVDKEKIVDNILILSYSLGLTPQ